MFRKDPDVVKTWEESRPDYFSTLQKEIASQGISMLQPGGMLLYSTCTFSPQENEEVVSYILENFPQMELLRITGYEGFSKGRPPVGQRRFPFRELCQDLSPPYGGRGTFPGPFQKGRGFSFYSFGQPFLKNREILQKAPGRFLYGLICVLRSFQD